MAKRKRHNHLVDDIDTFQSNRPLKTSQISARNEAQAHYLLSIQQNTVTFGVGPAGTGKTFLAAVSAADSLKLKEVDRIIITRPVVEAGESLGFLPGELNDKFAPYFQPVKDVLVERLGPGYCQYAIKHKSILPLPLAYMRGYSFNDCFVILDEAQNATSLQIKMLLTRIGSNCRVVITGDPRQTDIDGDSGLVQAMDKVSHIRGVGSVVFEREDICRSGIVQRIVEAYEK